MAMTRSEFENKCEFMLKRFSDMNGEEILKMSIELPQARLNDLNKNEYLDIFLTLRIFMKDVDIALMKNELFQVHQPRIAEDMMNTHKAFHEKGVCNIVMEYANGIAEIRDLCDELDKKLIDINPRVFLFLFEVVHNPLFDNGFSGLLENIQKIPLDSSTAINHMLRVINYIPRALFESACERIEERANEVEA